MGLLADFLQPDAFSHDIARSFDAIQPGFTDEMVKLMLEYSCNKAVKTLGPLVPFKVQILHVHPVKALNATA